MNNITDRQRDVLFAIIEEYAEVATPVGSVTLAKLFDVSSATIRAEMSRLEEMGLIAQPHTSAGRIPTDAGYRLYVNSLVDEDEAEQMPRLDRREAKAIEIRITSQRAQADWAIRSAVDTLVELTGNLGLATVGGQLYVSGIANLFSQPEFVQHDTVQRVARLLDNLEPWLREAQPGNPLNVYIGSENPIGKSSGVSLVISKFRSPLSNQSYIGLLGPTRQNYGRVMNLVRSAGMILETNL